MKSRDGVYIKSNDRYLSFISYFNETFRFWVHSSYREENSISMDFHKIHKIYIRYQLPEINLSIYAKILGKTIKFYNRL